MKTIFEVKNGKVINSIDVKDGTYVGSLNQKQNDKTQEQIRKLWATIDEISKKVNGNKNDNMSIYFQILLDSGQHNFKVVIPETALDDFKRNVRCLRVLSREVVNHRPMVVVETCMVGVSEMDKKEVAQVIKTCIRYADEIGVATNFER